MQNIIWDIWNKWKEKERYLLIKGLKNGQIFPYEIDLIENLRNVYDGGIPASITLLSNYLSNGQCHERAFLLSRAFIDDEYTKEISLLQADIDGIRLNPIYIEKYDKINQKYARHTVVKRITVDGDVLIYDTSMGFVLDYDIWKEMQNPTNIVERNEYWIRDLIEKIKVENPDDFRPNPMAAAIIIPEVEKHYNDPDEQYAGETGWLQGEVDLFKTLIGYDNFCKQNRKEIKKLKLRIDNAINKTEQ